MKLFLNYNFVSSHCRFERYFWNYLLIFKINQNIDLLNAKKGRHHLISMMINEPITSNKYKENLIFYECVKR